MPRTPTLLAALLCGLAASAPAVEPGGDVSVERDLLSVLRLRGKPCDAIASHERVAESVYDVRCRDGNLYRIRVGADERVVVEERS